MKITCPSCGSNEAEDWAIVIKCPTEGCQNSYEPLIEAKKKAKEGFKKKTLELEIEELERQIDPIHLQNVVDWDDLDLDLDDS